MSQEEKIRSIEVYRCRSIIFSINNKVGAGYLNSSCCSCVTTFGSSAPLFLSFLMKTSRAEFCWQEIGFLLKNRFGKFPFNKILRLIIFLSTFHTTRYSSFSPCKKNDYSYLCPIKLFHSLVYQDKDETSANVHFPFCYSLIFYI